jgi:uncharacterized protein Yka (UPF0111/DUF47 family)
MESACKAAEYLEDLIEHYDPAKLDAQVEEIHRIEHEADLNKHTLMQKLAKEFITPIEREDIILLLQQIDNVTDFIEDVVRKMFMYNVHAIRYEAVVFASIISCAAMSRGTLRAPRFSAFEPASDGRNRQGQRV